MHVVISNITGNNENGTIINKTLDRFDSGKDFGHVLSQKIAKIPVKLVQEMIFVKIREHGHFLADSENIFGRSFQENPANLTCKRKENKNYSEENRTRVAYVLSPVFYHSARRSMLHMFQFIDTHC